jgi:hypothetical protein
MQPTDLLAVCDDDLHSEIFRLFAIGFVLSLFIVWKLFRSSRQGPTHVGLQLSYLAGFWMNHWAVLAIYLLPWYCGEQPTFTLLGARQALFALIGYTAGLTLIPIVFKLHARAHPSPTPIPASIRYPMLTLGILFQVVLPRIKVIPGLQWIFSGGQAFAVIAVILSIWNAICKRDRRLAQQWLLCGLFFPFSTIINAGFLGFGVVALLPVVIFSLVFLVRKNLFKLAVLGTLGGYLLLSVFVTYMRDRTEIRKAVWKSQDFSERFSRVASTFSNFEFFSPHNDDHLKAMDARLNQNWLVGAAVVHTESTEEWAAGDTLRDAALGFIPRLLWPDKPEAGSGDLVSKYTGIEFDQSTSVGIGQVMEFYVNYGTPMVVLGFFIWGGVLAWLDTICVRALSSGNIARFITTFMIGLPMLAIGGSLLEVVAGVTGSLVMAYAFNTTMVARRARRRQLQKPVPAQA